MNFFYSKRGYRSTKRERNSHLSTTKTRTTKSVKISKAGLSRLPDEPLADAVTVVEEKRATKIRHEKISRKLKGSRKQLRVNKLYEPMIDDVLEVDKMAEKLEKITVEAPNSSQEGSTHDDGYVMSINSDPCSEAYESIDTTKLALNRTTSQLDVPTEGYDRLNLHDNQVAEAYGTLSFLRLESKESTYDEVCPDLAYKHNDSFDDDTFTDDDIHDDESPYLMESNPKSNSNVCQYDEVCPDIASLPIDDLPTDDVTTDDVFGRNDANDRYNVIADNEQFIDDVSYSTLQNDNSDVLSVHSLSGDEEDGLYDTLNTESGAKARARQKWLDHLEVETAVEVTDQAPKVTSEQYASKEKRNSKKNNKITFKVKPKQGSKVTKDKTKVKKPSVKVTDDAPTIKLERPSPKKVSPKQGGMSISKDDIRVFGNLSPVRKTISLNNEINEKEGEEKTHSRNISWSGQTGDKLGLKVYSRYGSSSSVGNIDNREINKTTTKAGQDSPNRSMSKKSIKTSKKDVPTKPPRNAISKTRALTTKSKTKIDKSLKASTPGTGAPVRSGMAVMELNKSPLFRTMKVRHTSCN